jgi:ABC-2 type transport system ATP-binding protein
MISADRLTKRFGDHTVVDSVTFEVEKGEILGFLGPNAAGKTTTMKMLTCYFPPSDGTARIAGFDVVAESLQVRRMIGFLPENVPLYPEMTVREYLEFAAAAKSVPHADRRQAVTQALDRCNLGEVESQLIGTISRGFRQRVGLGQAIINNPPVLILDEPTRGIDVGAKYEIYTIMNSLVEQGMSIIMISSELPEILGMSDRIYVMSAGKIKGEMPVEDASQESIMALAVEY